MDLQEKLNQIQKAIEGNQKDIEQFRANLKYLKKKEKGYLKLIEGAKSLEQK